MNATALNQAIHHMCEEISHHHYFDYSDWKIMREEDLLYEVAVCIFSSQMLYELAVASADRLYEKKIIQKTLQIKKFYCIEEEIIEAFSSPISFLSANGERRWHKPRFRNRLARLFSKTITNLRDSSTTLRKLLSKAQDDKDARKILIQNICGFGPKQASLFLRRVGYSSNLAVLDTHVLDYLKIVNGFCSSTHNLSNLTFYEQVEAIFRKEVSCFTENLGCADLATWITMRVAKREALL